MFDSKRKAKAQKDAGDQLKMFEKIFMEEGGNEETILQLDLCKYP